jgi:predicted MFS family arabinose efflux permease
MYWHGFVLQGVAGSLGPATNWRLPFVVVSAPTIALAFFMLATIREPPRGGERSARAAWRLFRNQAQELTHCIVCMPVKRAFGSSTVTWAYQRKYVQLLERTTCGSNIQVTALCVCLLVCSLRARVAAAAGRRPCLPRGH